MTIWAYNLVSRVPQPSIWAYNLVSIVPQPYDQSTRVTKSDSIKSIFDSTQWVTHADNLYRSALRQKEFGRETPPGFFMWKDVEQSLIDARFDKKCPLIKQKYRDRNI